MAICAISMLPLETSAQVITWQTGRKDIITWSYNEDTRVLTIDGNGTLDKSNPTEPQLIVNETINSAKEIVIGEGITAINIFKDGSTELVNLEKVTLPSTIWAGYENNTNNTGVFNNCPKLQEVVFAEGTVCIYGFNNCNLIKSITIPKSVVWFCAFEGCSSLKSVHISDLKAFCEINPKYNVSAYYNSPLCNVIEHGVFDEKLNEYTVVMSEPRDLYLSGEKVVNLVIPESIHQIGPYLFAGCSAEKITFPKHPMNIGEGAFRGMTNLKSIEIPEGSQVGEASFEFCYSLKEITLNKECIFGYLLENYRPDEGIYTFAMCDNIEKIILNEGVTELPSLFGRRYSQKYCNGTPKTLKLNSITMPSSLENIDVSVNTDTCRFHNEKDWWQTQVALSLNSDTQLYIGDSPVVWPSGDVVIPDGVTSIKAGKFYNIYKDDVENAKVTSVKIPGSVTSIAGHAFDGLTSVNSFDIPESVTTIGAYAFDNTGWYNNQKEGLLYIKNNLVAYKKGEPLKCIEIKEGTKLVAQRLFYNDNNIEEITFPNSCSSIEEEILSNCQMLKKVAFGNGVKEIKSSAFSNCVSLEELDLPDNIEIIGKYAFEYCVSLKNISLGNGIKEIRDRAFSECNQIDEITLPASINHLDSRIFGRIPSLKRITINSVLPINMAYNTWGDDDNFYNCVFVFVPKECTDNYRSSINWNRFHYIMEEGKPVIEGSIEQSEIIWSLNVENKTLTLKGNGIIDDNENQSWSKYDSDVENINIEGDIEFRAKSLFYNTTWYKNQPDGAIFLNGWILGYKGETTEPFAIKGDIKGVSDEVFRLNNHITSFEATNGIKYIGKEAFYLCNALEYIKIEGKNGYISDNAFSTCENLISVDIRGISQINTGIFDRCTSLKEVYLNGTNSIPDYAFYMCESLIVANINGATEIGDNAFHKCTSLKEIDLAGVETIGESTFSKCEGLQNVKIYSSTIKIGNSSFTGCKSISEIEIEPGIERIPEEMFSQCDSITKITLPKGLKYIGSKAFSSSKNINEVIIYCNAAIPPTFEDSKIMASTATKEKTRRANTTVYVPVGSKALYEDAWTGFKEIIELEGLSIENVNEQQENNKEIYYIDGTNVKEIVNPGIYIINGKKVLKK